MIVISNTTPLNYLILTGLIDVLPQLFDEVLIPEAVFVELQREETPEAVRQWMLNRPAWLEVKAVYLPDTLSIKLDAGERDAILLAKQEGIALVIIDESKGRRVAKQEQLQVLGTVGVLFEASKRGFCDLDDAYSRLRRTTFFAPESLYQHFLDLRKKG
jgi:predicted nucleic acid-binding protein